PGAVQSADRGGRRRRRIGQYLRVRKRRGPALVVCLAGLMLVACTSGGGAHLPVATSADFPDLDAITENARRMATADGDPHASVSIVKSTDAAVWDHGSSGDPTRYREMYFVRLHGKFTDCPMCSRPSGVGSFGPARWA